MKGFTHAGRGVSFEVASKKKRGGSKGAKKNRPSRSSGNSRKSDKERKSGRKSGFGKRRGRQ
jgi:hypothetical protein